jgi:hypothetical protein
MEKEARALLECVDEFAKRVGWPDNKPREALREALAKGDGTEDLSAEAKAKIIQYARDCFESPSNDELEIDDEPKLSGTDDGVWVAAWVWVNKEEALR